MDGGPEGPQHQSRLLVHETWVTGSQTILTAGLQGSRGPIGRPRRASQMTRAMAILTGRPASPRHKLPAPSPCTQNLRCAVEVDIHRSSQNQVASQQKNYTKCEALKLINIPGILPGIWYSPNNPLPCCRHKLIIPFVCHIA